MTKSGRAFIAIAMAFATGLLLGVWLEHSGRTHAVLDWGRIDHWLQRHRGRPVDDRTAVTWPAAGQGRTMVALVFGQSNAANSGETPAPAVAGVHEFYRGRVYEARDPLLEATGSGGSIWMRLASRLVRDGQYDKVVLVPLAIGSTGIQRWAPGGNLHDWLLAVVDDARNSGLVITHMLWHQGEADAQSATPPEEYKARFRSMLESLRARGIDAPIYVARTTLCGKHGPSEAIRQAQHDVVDPKIGIRAGPDTDTLGRQFRYDGCHLGSDGLDRAAELWQRALVGTSTPDPAQSNIDPARQ